jgi:uncharacterized membrane protein YphA (DoxX/SURF4 family)
MTGKTIALWAARIALAALFIFASSGKLLSDPEAIAGFDKLGAPWLRWVVGACELAGGIGLLIPQTAALAAACLALLMVGAMASHVFVYGVDTIGPAAMAFALSAWVAWELRRRPRAAPAP